MLMLILSALVFAGIHIGVAGTRLRDMAVRRLGPTGFMVAFSVASLAGIFWMVKAYQAAPYVETWGFLEWWKPFAIVLMVPAFLLAVAGIATPNPTSLAQDAGLVLPPVGIVRVTRHPFLVGVGLWAVIHLIGNGDIASLVLFATFAFICFAGTGSIDAKRRRLLGDARWAPFAAQTSILPFGAVVAGRTSLSLKDVATWQMGLAVVAYALMLGGHAHLIGVSPFPG